MPAIKKRASISSRLEDVFEYVADWRNFNNYIPMFVGAEPTSFVQYGPGTAINMTMLLGTKMEMRTALEVVDFVKNRRIALKSSSGIRTKVTWTFADVGGKVLVTLDFEFEMPPKSTFRQDEKDALAKEIEEAWDRSLEMLKWIMESRSPAR